MGLFRFYSALWRSCVIFPHNATNHTFKVNLGFLRNCGDRELFPAQFIFINLLIIIINGLSLWVYLGFIVHCGDRELFSRTMQLTIHLRLI